MRLIQGVFGVGLFFFATGATNCEYFTDVTVPARDSDRPLPFGGIWNGEYKALVYGTTPLSYEAAPDETFYVVGGGTDNGGVKEVRLETSWTRFCYDGLPRIDSGHHTIRETQAGRPGERVSSGVYAARSITVPRCERDEEWGFYSLTFEVTAVDFHGNTVVSPEYVVVAELP